MNGVLIIDKPAGITSHDVIYRVRRILRIKAVGHTGTLDPFATGVLVILIGTATRLAQFLDKSEKEYSAIIQLGFETDTGDITGKPKGISDFRFQISDFDFETALAKFRGDIWQTPPMYSAKKIAGKKLYELAREGKEIERQPVKVTISKLELIELSKTQNPQSQIEIAVAVSAGTYIRTLAEDIGRELRTGAHLAELRRTRAGIFDINQAVTLEALAKLADENRVGEILIKPNDALAGLPQIVLDENRVRKTLHGLKSRTEIEFENGQIIRMTDAHNNLIAVGVFETAESSVQPRVVLP